MYSIYCGAIASGQLCFLPKGSQCLVEKWPIVRDLDSIVRVVVDLKADRRGGPYCHEESRH